MGLNDKKKSGFQLGKDPKKMLPVVLIPAAVIVLIAVIVLSDRKQTPTAAVQTETTQENAQGGDGSGSSDGEETSENTDENQTDAEGESKAEGESADSETENFESDTLKKDSVPEILSLMKTYFQARANADASALNQVYGGGEKEEWQLQKEAAKLRSNSKYVQTFENVTTYVTEGPESDTWLVYALADIRFNSVKTTAPMIMWCCVQKDSEGNYHILRDDDISDEMQKFVDTENHSENVRRLASSVNTKLKDAIESDEELKTVYGVLRDGSPVYEENGSEKSVVVEDEQTSASEESSAGADGDSSSDTTSAAESAETGSESATSGESGAES
ncbi:hypothetical protein [Brotaphodocola sp.]|uniref:hypothetical protein n=1 Tax=Brotaphodocola sp. TaxID=3073577 RepID=UPI003D7EA341